MTYDGDRGGPTLISRSPSPWATVYGVLMARLSQVITIATPLTATAFHLLGPINTKVARAARQSDEEELRQLTAVMVLSPLVHLDQG